jgi:hypothetical protein
MDQVAVADVANAVNAPNNPSLIVTQSASDLNRDHQIAFDVGCIVARRRLCTLLAAEVPGYAAWQGKAFRSNFYVPLTRSQVDRKIRTFQLYRNECRFDSADPLAPANLMATARFRGGEAGVEYAEAFELIRSVVAGVNGRLLV